MIQITKQQKEYLIENGFLKLKNGKYEDLIITKKQRPRRKKYYVPPTIAKHLENM